MHKPIAFKVRGGGNYSGTKGGAVKPNEKGGAGYLGYEDKTFTIATAPDQWICTMKPIISPTITTCKGSRGGCSDEALEEIKAVHAAREQQNLSSQPTTMNEPAQPAPVGKPIRYLSVCSGMEAASVAWHPLGWTPVGFSEIEPFPCAILKHRFPNTPNYGDLTQYQQWPLSTGDVDLIAGGPPCQAFSVAGLRRGLADPRGNLTLTYLGLVDKLRPKWVVYENVPGLLSVDGGRAFGSFLGALGQLGYGWAYRVLDAQYVGRCEMHPQGRGWDAVPQRRRRIFVVACLGDWRAAAEVLSLREGLRGYLEAGGKKRKGAASDAGASPSTGCWWDGGQVSQTLDAVLQKGQTMPEKNRFPAVLQPAIPFRKSKRACSTTDNETWVPAEVTNTLNNFDLGDTRTTPAVVEPQLYENHPNDSRVTGPHEVSPTVVSRFGTGGGNVPLVNNEPTAITFQPGNLRREAGAEPSTTTTTTLKASAGDQTPHVAIIQASELRLSGKITEQTTSPTLLAQTKSGDNEPLAVHPVVPLDGMNLLSRLGECGEEHSMQNFQPGEPQFTLKKGGSQHGVLTPMAVRRLTPNECLRLQGFPDNWSRIPWKGKPAEECPDGPQYKAAGNSMAVPCMFWIGQRIAAVEASPHA